MPPRPAPVTLQLDARDTVAIVRALGLPACLRGVAERIDRAFRRWPEFDLRARVPSHSPDGVIELMPVADASEYGFKYVNGHPGNPRRGLPTVTAFGVLADVATGVPTLFAELTLATAIRTAATSALAACHLARAGARTMALVGNGAQAEFQAIAFRELLGVRTLRLFDVDPAATAKLAANLAGEGFALHACASAADAARGADVLTTITADKANATIVVQSMVAPGLHLNAVGGDSPGKTELDPAVLAGASVFVEFEPQTRIEGDLQRMPADFPVTELWRVLTGAAPGRRHVDEVTVFDSVGFALEDLATLGFLRDAAIGLGIGRPFALVPQGADPKDLFGVLRARGGPAAAPGHRARRALAGAT